MPHPATCNCAAEVSPETAALSLHEAVYSVEIFGAEQNDPDLFKKLLRDPSERFDRACQITSDEDGELLISITFSVPVTLHALSVLCEDGKWCKSLKLYRDESDCDFETLTGKRCIQQIDIVEDVCGRIKHPVNIAKLRDAQSLQLMLKANEIHLEHIGEY